MLHLLQIHEWVTAIATMPLSGVGQMGGSTDLKQCNSPAPHLRRRIPSQFPSGERLAGLTPRQANVIGSNVAGPEPIRIGTGDGHCQRLAITWKGNRCTRKRMSLL